MYRVSGYELLYDGDGTWNWTVEIGSVRNTEHVGEKRVGMRARAAWDVAVDAVVARRVGARFLRHVSIHPPHNPGR